MTTTIELVNYKTLPEADSGTMKAFQEEINTFCLSQPGFLYRSISQTDAGLWHDIVYWQDMQSAIKAAEDFGKTKVCQDLDKVIIKDSMTMTHMQAITEAMAPMPETA